MFRRSLSRLCTILYKNCVDDRGKLLTTFLPVQQQRDGYNCGLFSNSFASEVLEAQSPIDAHFDVTKMREHLILCLENQHLTPFPNIFRGITLRNDYVCPVFFIYAQWTI